MPVNLNLAPASPVKGVRIGTVAAGIKSGGTDDMVLFRLAAGSACAALFTQNAFAAAPVNLCRQHMRENRGHVEALLVNSGNANAGTGQPGLAMTISHCDLLSEQLNIPAQGALPFSTGVIGQLLPDDRMREGIRQCCQQVEAAERASNDGACEGACEAGSTQWMSAARGIMTTDTEPKLTSRSVEVEGQIVTITGMAKGSGMIQPDMATMLAYVFTDASVSPDDLDAALRSAVDVSFNAITVDSDTSTNDSVVLCATGQGAALGAGDAHWTAFVDALTELCRDLAQAIIRDGEGATKFITVRVEGGRDAAECKTVAYSIANSPLVKTAMFASDANVGRLLMAVGKADIFELDADKVSVSLGDVLAFEKAGIADGYTEERGSAVMTEDEIIVTIDLARGRASAEVYTSDLSHDYVSINADYRS